MPFINVAFLQSKGIVSGVTWKKILHTDGNKKEKKAGVVIL